MEPSVPCADSNFSCPVCFEEEAKENLVTLEACGCTFCRSCLVHFVSLNIEEQNWGRLQCPDKHNVPIRRGELKRLLPPSLFFAYVRHARNYAVTRDHSHVLCPGPDCAAVCQALSYKRRPVRCADCGLKFCASCRLVWSGPSHKCSEPDGAGSEPEEGAKRCPKCGVTTYREDGCHQVRCSHCGHSFCWLCLADLERDHLHFITGACRQARGQVFCNRLILGVSMCAIGILGLIISPFLILCAPCACFCPRSAMQNLFADAHEDGEENVRPNRFTVGTRGPYDLTDDMTDEEEDKWSSAEKQQASKSRGRVA